MGYFSNATEGDEYVARYCSRCVHRDSKPDGCSVWAAHLLFAYQVCDTGSVAEQILDELIPRQGIDNAECRMFVPLRLLRAEPGR